MKYENISELRKIAKKKGIKNSGRKSEENILAELREKKEENNNLNIEENLELRIKSNGWCEELGKSYFEGLYIAKDKKEFDILKKYSE